MTNKDKVNLTVLHLRYLCILGRIRWRVILEGSTILAGRGINNGVSIPATIAYPVEDDIYIIAVVSKYPLSRKLEMVKIQVTGEKTFKWLDARTQEAVKDELFRAFQTRCEKQETFTIDCFEGVQGSEDKNSVAKLAAVSKSGRKTFNIKQKYII